MNIPQRVTHIIAEYLKIAPEEIKPEATFLNLGAGDLDIVEIIIECETTLQTTFPDDATETLCDARRPVGDLITQFEKCTIAPAVAA